MNRFPRHGRAALLGLLAALALPSASASTHAAPPAGADTLITKTYDVRDLVESASVWRRLVGRAGGWPEPVAGLDRLEPIEALARVILTTVRPEGWRGPGKGAATLREVNGTKLEIRAAAKQHEEVANLLDALRRVADVAVIVEGELYEVDAAFLGKHVKAVRGRRVATPVAEAVAEQLRKEGTRLKSGRAKILPGESARFFSLRSALVYPTKAGRAPATAFTGVTFRARVDVTPDRRFVRLALTQHSTDLLGYKTEGDVKVPELAEESTTEAAKVGDGAYLLLAARLAPEKAGAPGKERAAVLLVRPLIYIEEEEWFRNTKGR
jgi:hypothetical protein